MITARVVLDSLSPDGVRLTTLEVVMPRIVLAEFNTHRAFSRNSASSRAIPAAKMIERVDVDPFIPLVWPRNQAGMQGGENLEDVDELADAWLAARDEAMAHATGLAALGLHKSLVNRLLEPYLWHTVLVTAVEWDNFFAQRDSPLAESHMELVAQAMRVALEESVPSLVEYGDWHTPLIRPDDGDLTIEGRKRISAARCARVSYLTHEGKRDIKADIALYERLVRADPPHWSPLEHVATPARPDEWVRGNFNLGWDEGLQEPRRGGWHQMRHVG